MLKTFDDAVRHYAVMAANAAPKATAQLKALLHGLYHSPVEQERRLSLVRDAFDVMMQSPESQIGMQAFLEKRPVDWFAGSKL